ncbi:hypothetical protein DCAR_0415011 [Daucus carota subsp. sativus]|uniref:TTF-type domain-containing protein n=1 Tax=Daucus carota subsp. sativus TaxID=79200 RepID=A0AAF1AUQ9_DAUCS|nr:hypothetical protein DCAR_0415011 [Daucus carota subsp. sativus]
MFTTKYPSGNDKRKRKKEEEEEKIKPLKGSLQKLWKKTKQSDVPIEKDESEIVEKEVSQVQSTFTQEHEVVDEECANEITEQETEVIENEVIENREYTNPSEFVPLSWNICDPRVWDGLDSNMRDLLVEKGPIKENIVIFPKDKCSRGFSTYYYDQKLRNGELVDRKCNLASVGVDDWVHLGEKLKQHEDSLEHLTNLKAWAELQVRLKTNQTIDKELQEQIKKDTEHWRHVMIRIIAVVKRLAMNNLAFRGENEKIFEDSNGNFLGFLESIADVKSVILKKIKEAKYFSVILDCTPDASRMEQMTLVIRCVDVVSYPVKIEEYFLEFLNVENTSGLGLFGELEIALKSLDLNINDVRGQGYDNGSNMRGKHQGVQKRLLDVNPRAFYMPCGCHSLNLVLSDMANSCVKGKSFFGACQALYNFSSFEFILSLVIWHDILHKINLVSKNLQYEDMRLDVAITNFKGLVSFFEKYRENGFTSAMIDAKELANEMDVEPVFLIKRRIKRNKQFEQMELFESVFGFLFDAARLISLDDEGLKTCCLKLDKSLTHGDACDIDVKRLLSELQILQEMLPSVAYECEIPWNSLKVLEFVKKMDMFPNILMAYRILLTIPITVASAERSFSKLKLIKSYLRTSMTQDRLNGLAILSIEKNILKSIDVEHIIDDFASKNARRGHFK